MVRDAEANADADRSNLKKLCKLVTKQMVKRTQHVNRIDQNLAMHWVPPNKEKIEAAVAELETAAKGEKIKQGSEAKSEAIIKALWTINAETAQAKAQQASAVETAAIIYVQHTARRG